MAQASVSFSDQVRAKARALGFDAVGIARASAPLDRDFARYQSFLQAGMNGEMTWLAEHGGTRERLDGPGILLGAKSIVCVARRYRASSASSASSAADDSETSTGVVDAIARYARGRDYHDFLRRRVRRLAAFIRSLGTPEQPALARPLCDVEPILERAWAVRAGLGFVGKNGMLIVPGLGSMVLLGEVVTTLDLNDPSEPMTERCGSCTRCLDACPTGAFVAPFVLDPRRCVSYLTIEHKTAVPLELRSGIGSHLFGCDDCQTACPFNAGAAARSPSPEGDPFSPFERWSRVEIELLLSLDEPSWRALFAQSPLKRAGREGIARNAALVLGNGAGVEAIPALRAAAAQHDDAVVREAAAWAIERIEARQRARAPLAPHSA